MKKRVVAPIDMSFFERITDKTIVLGRTHCLQICGGRHGDDSGTPPDTQLRN